MAKKIEFFINSAISEVTANAALKNAGIPKKAAEVIRDGNGKVTMVRITLPETASAAAENALKATPGVAGVQTTDIIPGTKGLDFEATVDWSAQGYQVGASRAVESYAGGEMSIALGSGDVPGLWTFNAGDNPLPFNIMGSTFEMKAKFVPEQGASGAFAKHMVWMYDDMMGLATALAIGASNPEGYEGVVVRSGPNGAAPNRVEVAASLIDDQFHTWKYEILPAGAGVRVSKDDAVIYESAVASASRPNSYTSMSVTLDGVHMTAVIDWMRWTPAA